MVIRPATRSSSSLPSCSHHTISSLPPSLVCIHALSPILSRIEVEHIYLSRNPHLRHFRTTDSTQLRPPYHGLRQFVLGTHQPESWGGSNNTSNNICIRVRERDDGCRVEGGRQRKGARPRVNGPRSARDTSYKVRNGRRFRHQHFMPHDQKRKVRGELKTDI